MKKDQFISLLSNPEIPDSKVSGQLHDVLMNYPYCQSARMLYVKSLTDQHSILYNDQLKIASAYANDRSILYELMNKGIKPEEQGKTLDAETIEEKFETKDIAVDVLDDLLGSSKDPAVNELTENLIKLEAEEGIENIEEEVGKEIIEQEDSEEEKEPGQETDRIVDEIEEDIEEKPVVKKEALSPQEIIRQRLAELNKEEEIEAIEPVKEDKIELEEVPKHGVEAGEEKVEFIEEERDEVETVDRLQPEIVEARLVDEEHLDLLDEVVFDEITSAEISNKDEIAEVADSSFTEEVRLKSEADEITQSQEMTLAESKMVEEVKVEDSSTGIKENEEHSFLSWLKAVDKNAIVEIETETSAMKENVAEEINEEMEGVDKDKGEGLKSSNQLIEQFIKEDPKIEPGKAQFYSAGNMAKNSIVDNEDVASETLANIYLEQGNRQKAIKMLELLSLKNPKKSPYFAARIKDIKNTIS